MVLGVGVLGGVEGVFKVGAMVIQVVARVYLLVAMVFYILKSNNCKG